MPELHSPSENYRPLRSLLRRGWLFIVLGTVVGLGAGAGLASILPKSYTASASVIVTPTGVGDTTAAANARTSGAVNLDTEAQVVTSTAVAKEVKRLDQATQGMSIGALTNPVTISVPANTTILTISYRAKTPVVSAARANDFARAYLSRRTADAEQTLNAQIDKAQTSLTTLSTQLKSVSTTISGLPAKSSQLDLVRSQRSVLLGQIKKLTTDITGLSTTAITPGRTLKRAVEPASPSSPSRVLLLSAGLAAGLLLGLVAAWLRFAVRTRLRRPDDVAHHLKLPVLGAVPAARHGHGSERPVEITASYRRIANVLLAARTEPGVILITGQCTTAALEAVVANLARALASHGASVAVATTIDDDEVAARAAQVPAGPDVRVADLPANADRATLDAARDNGYLLVAGADPAHSPEVQAIGAASDAVMMVIEARARTRQNMTVLAELDAVGAPLLGAVLVPSARWWGDESTDGDDAKSTVTSAPTSAGGVDQVKAPEDGQRGTATALGDSSNAPNGSVSTTEGDNVDPVTPRDAGDLRPARRS